MELFLYSPISLHGADRDSCLSVVSSVLAKSMCSPSAVFAQEKVSFTGDRLVAGFQIAVIPSVPNINPYPTAFPYGNGMVLHFYQQQESSTTKTVHKVINKRLKTYV